MVADVVDLLRCPVCEGDLAAADSTLRCSSGHSFDVARQGYVNLVPGAGDSADMVEARETFLAAGHLGRLADALAEHAREALAEHAREALAGHAPDRSNAIIDLGAGTGYYLARVLDALADAAGAGRDARGLAIDSSPAALRRAARAHPRAAAVGADAWKPLPLRDGIAVSVLSVFAPRNAGEMARVLAPGGSLIAVTPTTRHLHELVGPLGLLSVPDDKEDRLDAQLSGEFELAERRSVEYAMFLSRDEAAQVVRMGPSAWHVDEASVNDRLAALPDPLAVTTSVTLSRYAVIRSTLTRCVAAA